MNPLLMLPMQIVSCILLADFLSGLFHWLEDAYGKTSWPLVGRTVIEPNLLHHTDPRAMTRNNWWRSANVQVVLGGLYLGLRWAMNALTWRKALVVGLLVNANEIHKWAHRNAAENGRLITWMQRRGLVQSPKQHARHHRGLKNNNYCTVTDTLNPVLDKLRFWERIEVGLYRTFGWRRRLDHAFKARLEKRAA